MTLRKRSAAAPSDIEDFGLDNAQIEKLRAALLEWYDANHRILPWRANPHSRLPASAVEEQAKQGFTPRPGGLSMNDIIYRVWVCEVMSQQTQLSRVCQYFGRWIGRWPDVGALAAASQDEVNDAWAGLGYYRRARYLLEGARYVAEVCGGVFPTTAEGLRAVPGVGPYTAAAVASNACDEAVAVIDGNVIRVLARLLAWSGNPATLGAKFAAAAGKLLSPSRPGDFNQAMMELGAVVCVPGTAPDCARCPVSAWCRARALEDEGRGSVTDYPSKVEKAARKQVSVSVGVLEACPSDAGSEPLFLIVKRPDRGLLAGLWQFPLVEVDKESAEHAAATIVCDAVADQLAADYAFKDLQQHVVITSLGRVQHVFSHIDMTIHAAHLHAKVPADLLTKWAARARDRRDLHHQWVSRAQLESMGLSSSVRKVYNLCTSRRKRDRSGQGLERYFKPVSTPSVPV